MAEEDDFPFEELPEEVKEVEAPIEADASENEDEGFDYLSIPLTVEQINVRRDRDQEVEQHISATVTNSGNVVEGLTVLCSINIRIKGPREKMPKVDIGSVIDVLV